MPMLRNGTTGDWIGTFKGHKGAVWSCVLTHDSYLTATGSADFTAKLWDSTTGEERHTLTHPRIVRTVAFSNSNRTLVTGGADAKVRAFDLGKGSPQGSELTTAPKALFTAAFSRDDRLLFTSCTDVSGVCVWDVRTGDKAADIPTQGNAPSIEVCRTTDVITIASSKQVTFLSPSTLAPLQQHALPHTVQCASYSHERGKFVVGGEDMWVRLYDYQTASQLDCAKGHHGPVHTISFAPGGALFASGSEDGTIRIWETEYYLKEGGDMSAQTSLTDLSEHGEKKQE